MLHMLLWLYTYAATLCVEYFTCFRHILQQMLHVANVFISRRGKQALAEEVPRVGAVPTSMHRIRGRYAACEQQVQPCSSMQATAREQQVQLCSSMQSASKRAACRRRRAAACTRAAKRGSSTRTRAACADMSSMRSSRAAYGADTGVRTSGR
jgi:hypothetical protein